jgi:hypothetical protein
MELAQYHSAAIERSVGRVWILNALMLLLPKQNTLFMSALLLFIQHLKCLASFPATPWALSLARKSRSLNALPLLLAERQFL